MAGEFFDHLSQLVSHEIGLARKAGDDARAAEVVAALSDQLGKSIAVICLGDPEGIETMLTASEATVAAIAVDTGNTIGAIRAAMTAGHHLKGIQK